MDAAKARCQSVAAPQQPRQLRHVHSNAPRLIEGQHPSDVSLCACLAGVDVDERLSVRVENLEASRRLLDRPGRWEIGVMSSGASLIGLPAASTSRQPPPGDAIILCDTVTLRSLGFDLGGAIWMEVDSWDSPSFSG